MFVRFNANPVNKNTGDCTVRAISTVMNQSWRDTHADLAMTSYYLNDMPSSTNGVPESLREFPFEETTPQAPAQNGGVSREEFDSLSKKIDKLIADLGGNANG